MKTVFLVTDTHIKHESFLQYINNMLTSSFITNLFEDEEMNQIIEQLKSKNFIPSSIKNNTHEIIWDYFQQLCIKNLHIILSLSPANEKLAQRCRNFPAIINNTIIDWFFPWPKMALKAVASSLIYNQDQLLFGGLGGFTNEEPRGFTNEEPNPNNKLIKDHIINHMVYVHQSTINYAQEFYHDYQRRIHITASNYLDYIAIYKELLTSSRDKNLKQLTRLTNGLNKLNEANKEVEQCKLDLQQRKMVVDHKSKEIKIMIKNIKEKQIKIELNEKQANEKK